MTAVPVSTNHALALDQYFKGAFGDSRRIGTFDMIDVPDLPHFANFPRLDAAVRFLDQELRPPYERADMDAIRHQTRHRLVARLAIGSGGLAIGFAILQLALQQTVPQWTSFVTGLEAVAVTIGVVAVCLGLWARFDRQWLLQRHISERLRMLKFQALGRYELWAGDMSAWQEGVWNDRAKILDLSKIDQVEDWAAEDHGTLEPAVVAAADHTLNDVAIASYYRWKRADFQAEYFKRQGGKLMKGSKWLHHVGLPLFLFSSAAVVLHFAIDLWGPNGKRIPGEAAHGWELVGIWALTFAALLPVLSLCVRAWIGAFEFSRSGHLFKAKHHVLVNGSADLCASGGNCVSTLRQIASIEHTLEQEHREWLRLLLAAEWFL